MLIEMGVNTHVEDIIHFFIESTSSGSRKEGIWLRIIPPPAF